MLSNQDVLKSYGVDYELTMDRFMGNEALYVKILCKLGSDANASVLNRAIINGDLSEAFNAAHALKGVASNLGLAPLCTAVSEILEPLRRQENRDDYPELNQAVQEQFVKAVELTKALQQ